MISVPSDDMVWEGNRQNTVKCTVISAIMYAYSSLSGRKKKPSKSILDSQVSLCHRNTFELGLCKGSEMK